ncbi:MAG TPA: PAS domain S-box protein [Mycobacteriales bacterium]|nr:PAS domain S-box protein [Mycobacteriales bacterium]
MTKCTVVLVDDTAEVRMLVRTQLRLAGSFTVVAEGTNGDDALRLAREHQPDILLLDVSMPGTDGLAALPAIVAATPATRVVVYSGFEEPALAARAVELGAAAFIPKSRPVAELPDQLLTLLGVVPVEQPAGPERPAPVTEDGWQADGVLARHSDHFPLIFEQATIGMATMTLTGRVVRANASLGRFVARSPEQLVGVMFEDLLPAQHRGDFQRMIESVSSRAAPAGRLEHQLDAAGSSLDALSTVARIEDASHQPLYLLLQVHDMSSQRRAEEALRLSEERFRVLVEGVRDYGVFMLDPTGHIASWNTGAERIKGYTAEEIVGRHFRTFYTKEAQDDRHPERELEIAKATGRYEEEGWRVRKDGTQFYANVVISALHQDGELVGFAKVTRDITERQRMVDAREQATRAAELLAVIAHELRSPVGIIVGSAQLLSRHWAALAESERAGMLASLESSGGQITRLVEDLLTASRLEAGALLTQPQDLAVRPVLQTVAETARRPRSPGQPAPPIDVDCPDDVVMYADAARVTQMVANYVSNALRYGVPPVRLSARQLDGWAEIAVRDEGAELPEELASSLFSKFPAHRDTRGIGLGLFIVRELARAHGGDAGFTRDAGGNVFWLRLPADASILWSDSARRRHQEVGPDALATRRD